MAHVRESGTAIATAGGVLRATATCGLLPFPPAPLPPPLLPGVEVAAELGDRLAAFGGEKIMGIPPMRPDCKSEHEGASDGVDSIPNDIPQERVQEE